MWLQSQRKEKGKNHKLPSSRHFLKFKMSFLVKFSYKNFFLVKLSHKIFPLFNRFSTFDKNVNLSKANPEAKNLFLAFPSLNTSIFFPTDLKIASTLRPFERLDSKSHPSRYRSLTILNKRKVNSPNGNVFKLFSITANKSFLPNSQKKDNLIKLIQIF